MKRLLIVFLTFLLFAYPQKVLAKDFAIENFHTDIAILKTGEVAITEKLQVDYRDNQKHGIYRDMPFVYEDENGTKTYTELSIEKVTRNNADEPYELQKDGGNLRIKIGDANRTVAGKQLYQISYTAKGVLRAFPDYDELYWNVTGNNWPTNIDKASALVTLPKDGMQKIACYQGYSGSTGTCSAEVTSATTATFSSSRFISEGEGMTIVAGFEKGIVPILTVTRPKTFWEKFISWPSQFTLWTGILGAFGFIVYRWYKTGRDPWFGKGILATEKGEEKARPLIGGDEAIVVEFTPPENLRPAEMGVLLDERADTTDVVATIIDLATRGYLKIHEIPKKWLFGKTDYELINEKKDTAKLLAYEKILLDNLFEDGDTVTMSTLKNTFYDELKEVKDKLYYHVVQKGLFPKNPETVWGIYFAIGIVLLIAGVFGVITTVGNDLVILADLAFAVVVAGVLLTLFSFHMPRRTAKGSALLQRARGYRMFIEKAETHRQQFFEKKNLFNEVLPYAIMFGLTDKFFNAMKDIGVKAQTTSWYAGSHPFSYGTFNASMNSFASGMSNAIASTPSSSGGFSSGSSGGGFGGGGGGSW